MSVVKAQAKYPVQEWKIPASESDEIWVLGLWGDYKFTCTCWGYQRKKETCKHIRAKRLELESLYGSIFNYCQMLKERDKT